MADYRLDPELLAAFGAISRGAEEQAKLERALGRSLLEKMAGRQPQLVEQFKAVGGTDPVILHVLEGELNDAFQELPVTPGVKAGRDAALSETTKALAKGSKSVEFEKNQLARLQGQPIKTLADLGGTEFVERYKIR